MKNRFLGNADTAISPAGLDRSGLFHVFGAPPLEKAEAADKIKATYGTG